MDATIDEIRKRVDEIQGYAAKAEAVEAEVEGLIGAVRSCAETAKEACQAMADAASTFREAVANMERSMADVVGDLKNQGKGLAEAAEKCGNAAGQVEGSVAALQEAYRAGVSELKVALEEGRDGTLAAQRRIVEEVLEEVLLKRQREKKWLRFGKRS